MSDMSGGAEDFEKVKALLLGDTSRRLEETVQRVEKLDARVGDEKKFSAATADALVDAFRRAEEKRPRDLSNALAPSVVSIIRSEIRNSKDMMVEALYPIMGRLVTAAVAGAFRDLVESLNARIDALVSANSWRLRMRAMATGRSLAEVALAEAEAGRLKRALLLERGSGRLVALWPAKDDGSDADGSADLESGMIAAITEFATKVYADKGGELRMLDIGAGKVFLRASPRVIVAGEFGGELSGQRERRLDEAFLSIVELHERDENDCTPDAIGGLLNDALAEPSGKAKSKTPVMIAGALATGVIVWFSWDPVLERFRERRIRGAFDAAMAGHPALAEYPLRLDVEHGNGRVVLRGLAANEAEPQAIVDAVARASDPYRVEREIEIVALASQTQDLRAGETRAVATLQEAQAQIETLRNELEETRAALDRLAGEHESPREKLRRFADAFAVFFSESDTLIDPAVTAARLDELATLVKAGDTGLRVVGYADDVGATVSSRSASRRRADKIVAMLVERGVPRKRLALVSRSTLNPIADSTLDTIRSRRVSFEVPYAGELDVR